MQDDKKKLDYVLFHVHRLIKKKNTSYYVYIYFHFVLFFTKAMLTVNIADARIKPFPGTLSFQRFAKTWCITRFHDQRFCTIPVSDYSNISWNEQVDIMDLDTNHYTGFSSNSIHQQHEDIIFDDSLSHDERNAEAISSVKKKRNNASDSADDTESKSLSEYYTESSSYGDFFSNVFDFGANLLQKGMFSTKDQESGTSDKVPKENRNDIDFIVVIEHEDIRHHLHTKLDMSSFRNAPDKNFDISLKLRHVRTSHHNSYISSGKKNSSTDKASSKSIERSGDSSFKELFHGDIRLIVNYCDDIYGEGGCENRICGNICHGDGPLETMFRKLFGSYSDSSQLLMKQHYKQQRIRKERQQMKRKNNFENNTETNFRRSSTLLEDLS